MIIYTIANTTVTMVAKKRMANWNKYMYQLSHKNCCYYQFVLVYAKLVTVIAGKFGKHYIWSKNVIGKFIFWHSTLMQVDDII